MRSGTSALLNQYAQQIRTPRIKATVSYNRYGVSATPIDTDIDNAIRFKGKIITYDNTFGKMRVYDSGKSLIQTTYWGVTILGDFLKLRQCQFYTSGDTLHMFGVEDVRAPTKTTYDILRFSSGNGTSWGATQLIYEGPSQINAMTPSGMSRIYIYEQEVDYSYNYGPVGATITYSSKNLFRQLYLSAGPTWEIQTLPTDDIYIKDTVLNRNYHLSSILSDNEDRVLSVYGATQSIDAFSTRYGGTIAIFTIPLGLRQYRITGVQGAKSMFSETDLISQEHGGQEIYLSPLSIGETLNFIGLRYLYNEKIQDQEADLIQEYTFEYDNMYMESYDGLTWSRPISFGVSYQGDAPAGSYNQVHTVLAGLTTGDPELVYFGSSVYKEMYSGVSEFDITDDIISYDNQNNDLINISIANYR